MFLSLRWKAFLSVLTMLLLLSGLLAYLNTYYLEESSRAARRQTFTYLTDTLAGILQQSFNRHLQLIDLLPSLQQSSVRSESRTGLQMSASPADSAGAKAIADLLAQNWSNLQFTWGLDGLAVYTNDYHQVWRSDDDSTRDLPGNIADPQWFLTCEALCRQTVIAPIIFQGENFYVLLQANVADLLIDFSRISRGDIGLIKTGARSETDVAYLPAWHQSVKLLTHAQTSLPLLQYLERSADLPATQGAVTQLEHNGETYDALVISAAQINNPLHLAQEDKSDTDIRFFLALNTSDAVLFNRQAKRFYISATIGFVVLFSGVLLMLMWQPILRLVRHARALPLLASGDLQHALREIQGLHSTHYFRDELDLLNETETIVCQQLADMQELIQEKSNNLQQMAHYDSLTNLVNRGALLEYIDRQLTESQAESKPFSLMFIDLDEFKRTNDTLGHNIGDALLKIVAKRLLRSVRADDVVARLGGDEFCLVINSVQDFENLDRIANHILSSLRRPIKLQSNELRISASIGIVCARSHGNTTQELLQNADIAMYRAKFLGRNKFQHFDENMLNETIEHVSLENELRLALKREEFRLCYQPQIELKTKKLCGFEALIRWQHPHKGLVFPDKFIPILEETGLIVAVGEWVIDEACRQVQQWSHEGVGPVRVAVNISPRQLQHNNLVAQVERSLHKYKIEPGYLELEVTESLIMSNLESAHHTLEQLRSMGVMTSIDDFGTGYSSLSYLRDLPLKKLKIDRSFINTLDSNQSTLNIVDAIIVVAKKLGMEVVAEGIEDQAQESLLQKLDCDYGQGYFYSRPVSALEAGGLLGVENLGSIPAALQPPLTD